MSIAICIATDGRTNFLIRTTPNRRVQFRDCQATVSEPVDIPRILQEPGVVVEIDAGFLDWLPGWIRSIPGQDPIKATIRLPEGYSLAEDYSIVDDRAVEEEFAHLLKPAEPAVGGRRRGGRDDRPLGTDPG